MARLDIDGACHCSRMSFEANIHPDNVVICHCTDCQAFSGAPYRRGLSSLTPRARAREGQSPPLATALRRNVPPQALDRVPPAGSRGPARVRVPSGADAGPGGGGFLPPGALGPIGRAGGPRQTLIRPLYSSINGLV